MSNYTHKTAPTQFVEAAGLRFAYRRFGATIDIPLLEPSLLHRSGVRRREGSILSGKGHARRTAILCQTKTSLRHN
jgi:hypothetical protein